MLFTFGIFLLGFACGIGCFAVLIGWFAGDPLHECRYGRRGYCVNHDKPTGPPPAGMTQ